VIVQYDYNDVTMDLNTLNISNYYFCLSMLIRIAHQVFIFTIKYDKYA